jgi:anti-anti-sigma factor
MEVKTDTKEKFTVIGVRTPQLSANMTEELCKGLETYLEKSIRNVVLNMKGVDSIDEEAAERICKTQQKFYEHEASFVICELQPQVEKSLDEKDLLEIMNVTPTESEAWDIVQMEEIERELLNDEDLEP